jgi:hypothetical protein
VKRLCGISSTEVLVTGKLGKHLGSSSEKDWLAIFSASSKREVDRGLLGLGKKQGSGNSQNKSEESEQSPDPFPR